MTKEQIYREALERIANFHDRVDIVEAQSVAEDALARAASAAEPTAPQIPDDLAEKLDWSKDLP